MGTIGDRVKEARINGGYKHYSTFASRYGITPSNMMCFEANKTIPNCKNLVTISLELNVSSDYLITGKGSSTLEHTKMSLAKFNGKMVGKRLKSCRLKKGYKSHSLFSKASGIPLSTVGDYERGKVLPSTHRLKTISDFFGVTIDWLLYGNIKKG